jgi:phosphoglycerol geranylgeranyltransferase
MLGVVEKYLLQKIHADGAIHLTLIDPEKVSEQQAASIAKSSEENGTAGIMIGGSTFACQTHLDDVIKAIKAQVKVPIILFPNNETAGLSCHADAIWFMSLLNSTDPYFLSGAQVRGAPIVRKFGVEPLPMGYIIVGDGGAAGRVGRANTVPYSEPDLAVAHALAGQYLGMRFIYLEGGSGAATPVPPEMIRKVKDVLDVPLIVGGGIRTKERAAAAVSAGADIIVTGNVIESIDAKQRIADIIQAIKSIKA